MQATMQRANVSSAAKATSQCLAPVRPAIAQRSSFKSGQLHQAQPQRQVRAQAAQMIDEDALVHGVDKQAQLDLVRSLPKGYHWYETMLIMLATLDEEARDKELAKFEAFMDKEQCMNIDVLVRPPCRLAYPMGTNYEGTYVLYTYAAKRQTAQNIQKYLSNPVVGSEDIILRHMTFCRY